MKNVTIRHVAAEAGVSIQTVSRVMNGGPNVSEAVRERVMAAVAKLDYVPNMAARRMGGTKSWLIVAFNDRARTLENWRSGRGNDWVDQMLLGAMLECEKHGYHLLLELVETDDPSRLEGRIASVLSSLRPDGVILTPPHSHSPEIAELLVRRGVPFVRLGLSETPFGLNVGMDDQGAARTAAEHLIGLGHRRIGFIAGSPRYAVSRARMEGFREAMAGAGLPVADALVRQGDFTFESGLGAAETLLGLDQPPTAIIASNDEMALAVLHIAKQNGVAVPERLSLVSFDDSPAVRFSVPPLTAIRQPIAAMAGKAAELLIQPPPGEDRRAREHLLPFELEVRGSTAPPAG